MYDLRKKQIGADYFQQRFPNDGQRFVAWYLRNVLFRDMNETRDDITDGTDDKQIDAVIIDDDKSLARIIQGKFIEGGVIGAEPLREINPESKSGQGSRGRGTRGKSLITRHSSLALYDLTTSA